MKKKMKKFFDEWVAQFVKQAEFEARMKSGYWM